MKTKWGSLVLAATCAATLSCASPQTKEGAVEFHAFSHVRDWPTPCPAVPQDHTIEVTPDHNSCKHAYVSKRDANQIMWYSAPNTQLEIDFTATNPFELFKCARNRCFGLLPKDLPDDSKYDYVAKIDGQPTADPNVIIKP